MHQETCPSTGTGTSTREGVGIICVDTSYIIRPKSAQTCPCSTGCAGCCRDLHTDTKDVLIAHDRLQMSPNDLKEHERIWFERT
jgi:hypothetical protein